MKTKFVKVYGRVDPAEEAKRAAKQMFGWISIQPPSNNPTSTLETSFQLFLESIEVVPARVLPRHVLAAATDSAGKTTFLRRLTATAKKKGYEVFPASPKRSPKANKKRAKR